MAESSAAMADSLDASLDVPSGRVMRRRHTVGPLRRGVHEMKDPRGWPQEPGTPEGPLDAERFEAAFIEICRPVAGGTVLGPLAGLVRELSEARAVDPFLVAALVYRESRCRPDQREPGGRGLLGIQPSMFEPGARLPFSRRDLDPERLLDAAHNLRVGIALLEMWQEEHPRLDERFSSTPHRTAVAHFIWGDRVWGASAEDRVLTARRRLLEHYAGLATEARPSVVGLDLLPPLEGTPRLATSGPGSDRAGGKREHRGLDIDAVVGEPVRAIADGVVQFAGIDRPGRSPALALTSRRALKVRARSLGPGGLFVRVLHADGVRSGYFHLSWYDVEPGQTVHAGEVIGAVGRSGMKVSASHLHFEIDRHGDLLDPAAALAAFVIPPEATLSHERAMAQKEERLARERRARRRAWLRARKRLTSEVAAPAPPSQTLALRPR